MMPKAVTFYKLLVRCDEKEWVVEKRFSEFDELFTVLKKAFADIPSLPPKTAFKLKAQEGILKRQQGLDNCLQALVTRSEILNYVPFNAFLQVRF